MTMVLFIIIVVEMIAIIAIKYEIDVIIEAMDYHKKHIVKASKTAKENAEQIDGLRKRDEVLEKELIRLNNKLEGSHAKYARHAKN